MFPNFVAPNNVLGELVGFYSSLSESSAGNFYLVGSGYTISNGPASSTIEYELDNGSGFSVKTLAEIAAITYSSGAVVQARVVNNVLGVSGAYTTISSGAAVTGGLSAYTATLTAICSGITIDGNATGSYPTEELSLLFSGIPTAIQYLSFGSLIRIRAYWYYQDITPTGYTNDVAEVVTLSSSKTLTSTAVQPVIYRSQASGFIYFNQSYFPDLASAWVEIYNQFESPF